MKTKTVPAFAPAIKRNPLAPAPNGSASSIAIPSIEAVVVDVIVNETHPYYSPDGYNVGCIKIRKLLGDAYREDSQLEWAFPMQTTVEEWPLVNETVQITQIYDRIYYIRKINVGNTANNQALFGVDAELKKPSTPAESNKKLNTSRFIPENVSPSNSPALGEYFSKQPIYRLKHFEGDVIIQGRSGSSIRFGNSYTNIPSGNTPFKAKTTTQSPIILLSVGHSENNPTPRSEYGRIVENFNRDASSIWATKDMTISIEPATRASRSFRRSTDIPSILELNSIGLNSGTIYINARRNGMFLTSNENIAISANNGIGIETDDVLTTYSIRPTSILSRDRVSVNGRQVFIGSTSDNSEPLVLGNQLNQLLINLIQGIVTSAPTHVITAMGPGSLNPQLVATLQQILVILRRRDILSDDNFVIKNNEVVD